MYLMLSGRVAVIHQPRQGGRSGHARLCRGRLPAGVGRTRYHGGRTARRGKIAQADVCPPANITTARTREAVDGGLATRHIRFMLG
jgi:hypothetical protein